jgi:hypothetical protein
MALLVAPAPELTLRTIPGFGENVLNAAIGCTSRNANRALNA